jgi:hypothetical protein
MKDKAPPEEIGPGFSGLVDAGRTRGGSAIYFNPTKWELAAFRILHKLDPKRFPSDGRGDLTFALRSVVESEGNGASAARQAGRLRGCELRAAS